MDLEPTGRSGTGSPSPPDVCWLVLGLGNPGAEYADTLHNVGFRVLDILAGRWKIERWRREGPRLEADASRNVVLVKPTTFMNRTGRVLPGLFARHGDRCRLLVVCDDLALPVGRLRIREKGSAGGHNGLKSINSAYGSDEYVRVRVGIETDSERDRGEGARDYVLSPVPRGGRETLDRTEQLAADAVEVILSEGVRIAMSRFNPTRLDREQAR